MLKKPATLVLLLVIIVLLTGIVTALNRTSGPEAVLEKFESAYNSLDLENMLECFQPSFARPMQSLMSLLGGVAGVDLNDVLGAMPLLAYYSEDFPSQPKVHFQVIDSQVNGNTAILTIDATFSADGVAETQRTQGGFIKIDGTWYIDDGSGWN